MEGTYCITFNKQPFQKKIFAATTVEQYKLQYFRIYLLPNY